MKPIRLFLLLGALLQAALLPAQNGRKIYADYHGVRYTRAHDGKLGRWEMYADTRRSSTGRATLCYNADFMDETGRHDIAAAAYPEVGMQSNLDPDYLEYQILTAKAAGIDGFLVEWGFMEHENDVLLRTMQSVAAKYGFEVGVNWCDGWIYYDWITRLHPEIATREQKTAYYARCYRYLLDRVLSGPTAPTVDGRPFLYLFGPGATPEEYARAAAEAGLPVGAAAPAVLRRWAEWGTLEENRYVPVRWSEEIAAWKGLGMIPTAWLPARVRERDAAWPHWDHYATPEDCIEFMKPFRDSVWRSSDPTFTLKAGFVTPGMDNRGCAGWGRGHFFCIPRDEGRTYERMWEFCMASRDSLDMIFIASWSDYTEGHEIEPTRENGMRELRTTRRYAAVFKEIADDASGLELPAQLFAQRKRSRLVAAARRKTAPLDQLLDRAAGAIAAGSYAEGAALLAESGAALETLEKTLKRRTLDFSEEELRFSSEASFDVRSTDPELKIYLPPTALGELIAARTHRGYLEFEYFDGPDEGFVFLYSRTERTPKDRFSTVAKFRLDGSGRWRRVRVELAPENILYTTQPGFTFRFKGKARVRGVNLHYELIR